MASYASDREDDFFSHRFFSRGRKSKSARSPVGYVKSSTYRRGGYRNRAATYGVTVASTTGRKDFYFTNSVALNNFIVRAKRARNYKWHQTFSAI